jgi:hypothetical protein
MFTDRVETTHDVPENLAELIAEARKRVAESHKPVIIEAAPPLPALPPPEDDPTKLN